MPIVRIAPEGVTIEVEVGATLAQAARRAGVRLHSGIFRLDNCHGLGLCGECRVRVVDGGAEALAPEGLRERYAGRARRMRGIVRRGNAPGERLACQAYVLGDVAVRVRLREAEEG